MPQKNNKIVVTPYNKDLLNDLSGISTIIYSDKIEDTLEIYKESKDKLKLLCIKIDSAQNLSDITFSDELKNIPIALFSPAVGDKTKLLLDAKKLKQFNTQIYLPVDNDENIKDLRILSSLGINCGFYVKDESADINWEMVDDLFYYFAYTPNKKATIEPFNYLINRDISDDSFNFKASLLDDPNKFVYLDNNGNFSNSYSDLQSLNYIGTGISELHSHIDNYVPSNPNKAKLFINNEQCSYCTSWRVCKANYLEQCKKNDSYKLLFDDILEFIEDKKSIPPKKSAKKWQL